MAVLNGWQRLGIVASGLWLILASVLIAAEWSTFRGSQSNPFVYHDTALKPVTDPELIKKLEASPASSAPSGLFDDLIPPKKRLRIGNISSFLFLPVAFGWLLAYVTYWSVRWVRAGFTMKAK